MLKFLWNIMPNDYKYSVAIKKGAAMASKAIVGLLVGSVVGEKLSPAHIEAVGTVITVATTVALEALHDWAKLKFPNQKWL